MEYYRIRGNDGYRDTIKCDNMEFKQGAYYFYSDNITTNILCAATNIERLNEIQYNAYINIGNPTPRPNTWYNRNEGWIILCLLILLWLIIPIAALIDKFLCA